MSSQPRTQREWEEYYAKKIRGGVKRVEAWGQPAKPRGILHERHRAIANDVNVLLSIGLGVIAIVLFARTGT